MQRRGRLFITCDAAAVLLIVILWIRAIGSLIALSITAEKVFVPIGADPIWPPAANAVSKLFYLLAVLFSVGIIIFRINDVTRPGLWKIAVLLAPWLYIIIRNLYSGSWPTPEGVLYVVVILALAALRPRPRVLIAVGALVVLTATVAIAFGVLMPEAGRAHLAEGVLSVRPDKAVFPSLGLLQGMFTQENSLGVYLAVGIPAAALLPRWWLRFPGLAVVAFAIAWSSARNSILAAACALVMGAVIWAIAEFGWRRAASTVARLTACALLVAMCVVPLTGWLSPGRWDEDAYTGRGVIWNGSLTHWFERAFLFGGGRDWYSRITKSETTTLISGAYSGHNQFVQFVATGGALLAVLALGSLLVQTFVITAPRNRYLVIGGMIVMAIAVSGWLETPLGYVDWSTNWTVTIVPLAILFLARPEEVPLDSRSP